MIDGLDFSYVIKDNKFVILNEIMDNDVLTLNGIFTYKSYDESKYLKLKVRYADGADYVNIQCFGNITYIKDNDKICIYDLDVNEVLHYDEKLYIDEDGVIHDIYGNIIKKLDYVSKSITIIDNDVYCIKRD